MNRPRKESFIRHIFCPAGFFALLLAFITFSGVAAENVSESDLTILFTTDIHSALIPHSAYVDEKGRT